MLINVGSLKCWSASGAFLKWLFNLTLNFISDFAMYWIQQILHSIRYINSLLLQLRLRKIYVFVLHCFKKIVCRTCLQFKFPDYDKDLVENPIFFFLETSVVLCLHYFFILYFCMLFLFLLKAKIDGSWNIFKFMVYIK